MRSEVIEYLFKVIGSSSTYTLWDILYTRGGSRTRKLRWLSRNELSKFIDCYDTWQQQQQQQQQQMDNVEILHFNFEKYKICMQNSAELYFAKIIIKTTSLNLPQNAREG